MFSEIKDVMFPVSALEESSIVAILDRNSAFSYVNPQFCAISKYAPEELIGRTYESLTAADFNSDKTLGEMKRTIEQGKVWKGEIRIASKDGGGAWLAQTIIPLVNEHGEVQQSVSIGTDISERKENKLKLMQTMENLRDIEKALDESSIVAITDRAGVITYVNEKFCEISKYEKHELLGKTHRVINSNYHPKTFFKEMWGTIKSGQVWRGEVKNRAKDGTEYWMNTTIVPFLDDNRQPRQFISIRSDITDRVKAEEALAERTEQLARTRDEAVKANMIKSQFLANMSHELRTPLNAIIGYSEMLREEAEELGETVFVEDLGKISKAGNHLLALINDILDISKIEAGKMELHLETCSLPDLIQDVTTTIRPLAEEKGNRLNYECIAQDIITTDVLKVRQILINLLSNANKFTDAGTITLRIFREARDGADGYSFHVQDTGIGMTPEQMEKLFFPFTQADASTTRKYGGTGLGLAISQRISQMLGGDIRVESEPDVGTSFICWLPIMEEKPREAQQSSVEADPGNAEEASSSINILLIDDEASNRELMQRYIAKTGWSMAYAGTGPQGIRLAKKRRPDVICLDILMPDTDGWEVLAALKDDPDTADIPVIVWTMLSDRQRGYALGVSEFLTKPSERDKLIDTISKYIRTEGTVSYSN